MYLHVVFGRGAEGLVSRDLIRELAYTKPFGGVIEVDGSGRNFLLEAGS